MSVDDRFLVMFMSRWKFLTAGCFTSQSHVTQNRKFFLPVTPWLCFYTGKSRKSFCIISYVWIICFCILNIFEISWNCLHCCAVGSFSDFLLSSFLICLYSRLSSLPETPAAIDWSYYRRAVANSGMVDDFEKKVRLFTQRISWRKGTLLS